MSCIEAVRERAIVESMKKTQTPVPIGEKYGRLTVLGLGVPLESPSGRKSIRWVCECDCGERTVALANNVRAGRTTSCGNHGHGITYADADTLLYDGMALRKRKAKGDPTDFMCIDACGRRADVWAYDYADPNEKVGLSNGRPTRYTSNLDHYVARCHTCWRRAASLNRGNKANG